MDSKLTLFDVFKNAHFIIILVAILMYVWFVYNKWVNQKDYDGIHSNKNKINNAIHESVNKMSGLVSNEQCVEACKKNCKTGHHKTIIGKVVEGTFDWTFNSSINEGANYSFLEDTNLIEDAMHMGAEIELMDGNVGSSQSNDMGTENANLKLLSKYLTLLLRKNEAEKELYTIQTGKRQVYNSPTLVQLNKKITEFKQTIRNNPNALKYFNENLDITL